MALEIEDGEMSEGKRWGGRGEGDSGAVLTRDQIKKMQGEQRRRDGEMERWREPAEDSKWQKA